MRLLCVCVYVCVHPQCSTCVVECGKCVCGVIVCVCVSDRRDLCKNQISFHLYFMYYAANIMPHAMRQVCEWMCICVTRCTVGSRGCAVVNIWAYRGCVCMGVGVWTTRSDYVHKCANIARDVCTSQQPFAAARHWIPIRVINAIPSASLCTPRYSCWRIFLGLLSYQYQYTPPQNRPPSNYHKSNKSSVHIIRMYSDLRNYTIIYWCNFRQFSIVRQMSRLFRSFFEDMSEKMCNIDLRLFDIYVWIVLTSLKI